MNLAADIRHIQQSLRQLAEGTVLDAEIVGDHIEVEVRLDNGKAVWAELVDGVGGPGGTLARVPTEGESVLVGLVDGDPTEGFVLSWLSDASTPAPDDLEGGRTYLVAPDGEPVEIRAGESTVELQPDGTVVVDADDIRLGGESPSDREALAGKVESELDALWTALTSHTHPGVRVGTQTSGPASATGSAGDVASDTVQSD